MTKKKKQKKLLSPIVTLLILIGVAALLSLLLSLLNVSANQTIISNGTLENTIVSIKNIFSKEGIIYFFSNIITNFNILEPFVLLIISIMAMSIAKASGILKHIFSPFKNLKTSVLTFCIVFIGVISTLIGDYSYIILLPFVAILYEYINKSPVLGIVTMFLGITLGYGTGLICNYNDYALGMLTQSAAIIDVDATYKYELLSNLYIMIASTVAISFLITTLIERYLTKRVTITEAYEDELVTSKKALMCAGIVNVLMYIPFVIMILPNGVLLDATQTEYVAQLFSPSSPFNLSCMFIFLLITAVTSIVYGLVSKNFKNNHEMSWGFTRYFDNIGYIFIMLFLASILTGIINWSNLGTLVSIKLLDIISLFDFTGIPLIVISFICIILMSILIPGSLEKWAIISPLLVPLFMRGNLTPDFAQFVFKAADSVGKIITPVFIYFIIMVGFIQKYNVKENKVTLFNTMKLIWPIIIAMIIFWLLILIIWYVAGLPLGIGTLATM